MRQLRTSRTDGFCLRLLQHAEILRHDDGENVWMKHALDDSSDRWRDETASFALPPTPNIFHEASSLSVFSVEKSCWSTDEPRSTA